MLKFFKKRRMNLTQLIVVLPLIVFLGINSLRFEYHTSDVLIFYAGGTLCILLALSFIMVARIKYQSGLQSLASTMVSLLSMQKIYAFSLIFLALLALTWLMDYLREFTFDFERNPVALAGSFYSASLLLFVGSIVIFIEKRKIAKSRLRTANEPEMTSGLIIALSKIEKRDDLDQLLLHFNDMQLDSRVLNYLRTKLTHSGEIDNDTSIIQSTEFASILKKADLFSELLSNTPLYPPLASILYHYPAVKYIWILLTEEAQKETWPTFQKIVKKLFKTEPGLKLIKVNIANPDDVKQISQQVENLHVQARLKYNMEEYQITTDITSGTTLMSVGMILACVRSQRQVQYLGQKHKKLQRIEVNVQNIPHLVDELMGQLNLFRAND